MRVYLYLTLDGVEDREGFILLKRAMLYGIATHAIQLSDKGFLFLSDKGYDKVSSAIKERRGRPFILADITEGFNTDKFKTNINIDVLRKGLTQSRDEVLCVDSILEKILNRGYASLTSDERDYLDAKSRE